MAKTLAQKEEFVAQLFCERELFELEVLGISCEADFIEVMELIATIIVREKLKKELNFLYLERFDDFKLGTITKAIFNQIANEWVSFATQTLRYSKDDALKQMQEKQKTQFIYSLALDYFQDVKKYIFEEIADTFLELVDTLPDTKNHNKILLDVLQSALILHSHGVAIQSFEQLWMKVRSANQIKSTHSAKLQILMAEALNELAKDNLEDVLREKYVGILKKNELESIKLSEQSLDYFDIALKRLKETMVQSMMKMDAV